MNNDEYRKDFVFQQIGNLLSSSHELSNNILRRLCYKDLISTSQVCQTWSNISRSILKKERRFRYLIFHPQCFPTTESKATLNNLSEPKKAFEYFLKQENIKMMDCCLAFTNGEWLYRNDIHTQYDTKGSTLSSAMTKLIPSYCQLGLICASGVIGTSENIPSLSQPINSCVMKEDELKNFQVDSKEYSRENNIQMEGINSDSFALKQSVGYSIEIEEIAIHNAAAGVAGGSDAISIILFPHQPGVKLNISYIDKEELYKKYRPNKTPHRNVVICEEEFNSICNLNPTDDLKALLLFYSEHNTFIEAFADVAVSRQRGNLALGGGLVRAVQQKGDILDGLIAVSFSGCNVKACSIVVPPSVKYANLLENHLNKLKGHYSPDTQSICFLFACCGRGLLWYRRNREDPDGRFNNVESKTFRKLFPDVPLVGFFGEGEVGLNYLPTDREDEVPNKKKRNQLFHQFTSIFVLVSIQ